MNRRIFILILGSVVVGLVCGCTIRHGDFTVVSNKMVRLSDFELDKAERVKNVVGKDVQHWILFIPTSGPPTLEGAIDDVFDNNDGDVLTDAVIKQWGWSFILYGQNGWEVKGDVVKTRKH